MHIFRHLAQKFLDIRQYAGGISIQSDEKSVGASPAQALCGIALIFVVYAGAVGLDCADELAEFNVCRVYLICVEVVYRIEVAEK